MDKLGKRFGKKGAIYQKERGGDELRDR